ncbi:MAG TPA: FkbM family methyltransferase [Thermoleophilaceae bacterium]
MPISGLADVGTPYGGYMLPVDHIGRGWLCYCVGTGADISFELELIRRWDARVRSFEAVAHFVEELQETAATEPRLTLEQAALAGSDGPLRMQVTNVRHSRSVSAADLYESDNYVEIPGRTLQSLMAQHGDDKLDLLKIDIEGLEYELLPTYDLAGLGVKVLCVQLHHTATVQEAKRLLALLKNAGYELIGCRPTVKLTFAHRTLIQTSGEHAPSGSQ